MNPRGRVVVVPSPPPPRVVAAGGGGGGGSCWAALPTVLLVLGVFSIAGYSAIFPARSGHTLAVTSPPQSNRQFFRSEVKWLVFEPWNGGWNNRRMSLELAFVLALKTNRTLVLPPVRPVAKLPGRSGYETFFNLTHLRRFVPVLTWEEFQPLVPHLVPSKGASVENSFCKYRMPNPRGFCENARDLRVKAKLVRWDFLKLVIAWPGPPQSESGKKELLIHAPRKEEKSADLHELAEESIIHFPQNLFGLFYHVFYYASPHDRQYYWRAVRDGLRFNDIVVERARRLVNAVSKGGGNFACVHVRRRDFKQQYNHQYFDADKIAENTRAHLLPRVYLATDESDPAYVARLKEAWAPVVSEVMQWKDVLGVLGDAEETPPYLYGVLEQVLCSKAEFFVGTKYSTFSAYITRLRGYDTTVQNKNCYFTDTVYKGVRPTVEEDKPFSWSLRWRRAFWSREYPEAWEGLDENPQDYEK
eukprot:Hpha_TRINITY_DN2045_c0_g1::TRINITY_DN2045_c0_g1_i1::g.82942::m.82942